MHLKFGVWSLAFYLLLVLSNNIEVGAEVEKHDHMHPKDGSILQTYLKPEDIKEGTVIHTFFDEIETSKLPHLIPMEVADSIPFSSSQLPYLLDRFNIPPDSPQAIAMKNSLKTCETQPMEGETVFCATSLEAMLDFVTKHFSPYKLHALVTRNVSKFTKPVQDFSIVGEPKEVPAPKTVACHTMSWPYTIYFCHYDIWGRRAFEVTLVGEYGSVVQAAAVCHTDTSRWDPHFRAFKELGVKHGSPVCHFFPADHVLWVPRLTTKLPQRLSKW